MVIAYLYWDLLNLYGNDGNIKILVKQLKNAGVDAEVRYLSVGDELDFSCYDMVYMGSGTEENQKLAIKALKPYSEEIRNAIDSGKVFLFAGNSIDMLGKRLTGSDDGDIEALGVFDYHSVYVDRIKKMYRNDENFLGKPVVGFMNHNYVLENNDHPLFDENGVHVNNFYGTYAEGPVLVRNPHFLKHILSILVKDEEKLEHVELELEEKAYEEYLKIIEA